MCATSATTAERDRARGEGEVVPRPRPSSAARRLAGGAVAAHLERRGDVDGTVERAGGDGPDDRVPRRRIACEAALRVVQPARVAAEHRHEPRRQRGGERGAERDPPERAQELVGVDGGRVQGEAADDDQRAEGEHAPVGGRLGGDVELAEDGHAPQPGDHREPVADDERIDEPDEEREGQRDREHDQHAPAHPRGGGRGDDRAQQRQQHERVLEGQRDERQHDAPERGHRTARGVQRARPAQVGHDVPAGVWTGSDTGRPLSTAIAK